MKDERICKQYGHECDCTCDGRDTGCKGYVTDYDDADVDEEAVAYNQQMQNQSDATGEYLEMRNMYEEGMLY